MTLRLLLCLILLAGAACTGRQPDAEQPAPAAPSDTTTAADPAAAAPDSTAGGDGARPGVPLPALLDVALGRAPDQEPASVLDRLNEPIRVEAESYRNRHDPTQIDTLRTYHYDGLRFTVYEVSAGARQMITRLVVTGEGYRTAEGLQVGSTRSEVEAALGEPQSRQNGAYVYELGEETPNPLTLRFRGDRVAEMEWEFYVD